MYADNIQIYFRGQRGKRTCNTRYTVSGKNYWQIIMFYVRPNRQNASMAQLVERLIRNQ